MTDTTPNAKLVRSRSTGALRIVRTRGNVTFTTRTGKTVRFYAKHTRSEETFGAPSSYDLDEMRGDHQYESARGN
jgi:hypothetical protein